MNSNTITHIKKRWHLGLLTSLFLFEIIILLVWKFEPKNKKSSTVFCIFQNLRKLYHFVCLNFKLKRDLIPDWRISQQTVYRA
jgi:hypothetical protein